MQLPGVEVEGDIYVPNPLSAGFSVEKLIRKLEGQSPPSDLGRVELKGRDDQVFGRRAGADWVENGRGAPSFTSSWGSKEPRSIGILLRFRSRYRWLHADV